MGWSFWLDGPQKDDKVADVIGLDRHRQGFFNNFLSETRKIENELRQILDDSIRVFQSSFQALLGQFLKIAQKFMIGYFEVVRDLDLKLAHGVKKSEDVGPHICT